MPRLLLFTTLILAACALYNSDGGSDDTGGASGGGGVDIGCDAWFNFSGADGSDLSFGDCGRFGVEGGFEENPDDTPMMRDFSYIFRGGGTSTGDCWVRWDQTDMCGPGYYPIDDLGSLKWKTGDCPGLPSTGSDSAQAVSGYVHVWALATSLTASGQTEVIMQAVVNGTDADGNTISGSLQLTELMATTVGTSSGCTVSTGDDDQDSYINDFYGGDDCNDDDILIHPGGLETCDGVDEDCDGKVDEGLEEYPWYADADSDGFGDDSTEVQACDGQAPDGYVGIGNDCDDDDASTNPGAAEICDEVDNDCDTVADEGGVCGR